MCGIAGLFRYAAAVAPGRAQSVVEAMTASLAHRGPDDSGLWMDALSRCVLGHRRLSIIDTSIAGHQPMSDASDRWTIVFNGELYNYLELRDAVSARVPLRGRTDTEVLLGALAAWGTDALARFDGMFAFAAFDRVTGSLLLARDPFGEKPLYTMDLPGGGVAFASELQALELMPGFDGRVDADAVAELLSFQYIGAPRTIYSGVRKLAPGHWMRIDADGRRETGRYFEFRPGESGFDPRSDQELVDELEDRLVTSIRRRLIADVPLGAFLSGGVDSSTVCALVRHKLGQPLTTFSIGFEGAPESEHGIARAFAAHLGTDHHEHIVAPHASEFLRDIGQLVDEPNADSSCLPTYLLSGFARSKVTVAVSGDGGDELFGGYDRYWLTLEEAAAGGSRARAGAAYYSERILVAGEPQVERLLGALPAGFQRHLTELRARIDDEAAPLLCRLRKTDVDNYMPGAVLAKVDRMSMRHSLEVRTPFLNVDLARFAERIPPSHLISGRQGKRLLRLLAHRHLPRELVDRPKQGFGLPMSRWARDELLGVAGSLLESEDSRLAAALGHATMTRFMQRQREPSGFSTYQLWAVAMLESWLRHHPARMLKDDFPRHMLEATLATRWTADRVGRAVKRLSSTALLHYRQHGLLSTGRKTSSWIVRRVRRVRQTGIERDLPPAVENNPAEAFATLEALIARAGGAAMPLLAPGARIAVITHALPPGGAERQWCYLAIGLKEAGYDVRVLCTAPLAGSNSHYLPLLHGAAIPIDVAANVDDAHVWSLGASVLHGVPLHPLRRAAVGADALRLAHLLNGFRPQAVFAQLDWTNIAAGIAAHIADVPAIVLSFRNYNPDHFDYLRNDWYRSFYQRLVKSGRIQLSGNSTLGNADYADWLGIDRQRVRLVANCIEQSNVHGGDAASLARLRQELSLSDDAPVVVGVFRLSEEKDPLAFIEVCDRIRAEVPQLRALLVGEGPLASDVERDIARRRLAPTVELLGRRPDVPNLMRLASLLLLTSRYEGMPNVAMEACMIGVPVVATAVGGTPDVVVDGRTGLLCPAGDTAALASACTRVLQNQALRERLAHAARERARSLLPRSQMVQQFIALAQESAQTTREEAAA